MIEKFDLKKIMDWLGFFLRCPICGYKYNLDQTRVVESEQNESRGMARILIHSDCNKCKSSVMFNIEVNGPEVFSVGMITDLTSQDSKKFRDINPISADDVINIHKELKKLDNDLVSYLTGKV